MTNRERPDQERPTIVLVLMFLLASAACSGGQANSAGSDTTATSATTTSTATAADLSTPEPSEPPETETSSSVTIGADSESIELEVPWRLHELLDWVEPPDQPLDSVFMIDTRRAALQLGVQPNCVDDGAAAEYAFTFWNLGHDAPYLWRDATNGASAFETEFGLSICDVSAAVDGRSPREPMAWLVDVPDTQVVTALKSDPSWSAELEQTTYGGTELFRWGDSPIGDLSRLSAARPGGYGGQVIIDEGDFVRSNNERELYALLDAQSAAETLAGYESVRQLLSYMDDSGAHSVYLYRSLEVELPETYTGDTWDSFDDLWDAVASRPKLKPYEFFALILGTGDGEDQIGLAVLNDTEEEAAQNTIQLESVLEGGVRISGGPDARWTDQISGPVHFETVGPLSIATFAGDRNNEFNALRWSTPIERDAIRWYLPT